ncbi:MAG: adenylosuccinate lyase [Armatimonadota bacterium]|nr:adenylosuccinate lyase [Armatimonadota bacterium]
MISRYCYPEMAALFELKARYYHWMQAELAVCDALAELGQIPSDAAARIRAAAPAEIGAAFEARVAEIEAETQHDLIAFLKTLTEPMGDDAKYVHLGVTSYDIEDTALGLVLRRACDIILQDLDDLESALIELARQHKDTLMMGRTHGVHAEPITFAAKLCVWIEELRRGRTRIEAAREVVAYGKISGAVGTYANIDPQVEDLVCQRLDLKPSPASTQILQRDRHAEYLCALAILASSLEKFATEIRNLQRTEILEVEEGFAKGQRGSSAMPHKRNPITCERISGLARVVRANALVGLENVLTWHERDLANSAPERVVLADSSILVDYMLRKFSGVVRGLGVYTERMRRNIGKTFGVIHSQQVMLALIDKGMLREEAYKIVQAKAMSAWTEEIDFRTLLEADERVTSRLSQEELDACFDPAYHTRHINRIYERVGI